MGAGVLVGIVADVGTEVAVGVGSGVAVGAEVGDAVGEGSGSGVEMKVGSGWVQPNHTAKSARGTTTTSLMVTELPCPCCQIQAGALIPPKGANS